jgi:hypothetical protein
VRKIDGASYKTLEAWLRAAIKEPDSESNNKRIKLLFRKLAELAPERALAFRNAEPKLQGHRREVLSVRAARDLKGAVDNGL